MINAHRRGHRTVASVCTAVAAAGLAVAGIGPAWGDTGGPIRPTTAERQFVTIGSGVASSLDAVAFQEVENRPNPAERQFVTIGSGVASSLDAVAFQEVENRPNPA